MPQRRLSRRQWIGFVAVGAAAGSAAAGGSMEQTATAGEVKLAARRPKAAAAMAAAAASFLATLEAPERSRVLFPFNDPERLNWHFVPLSDRKGLPLKEMSRPQQDAALKLLRAGLSARGFTKAQTIRQLELVLREMENGAPHRDPELYHFAIFGEPDEEAPWGWRYEGHHCSQNWTIVGSDAIASTPQFFGSNPAEVRAGPMKGTRVLAAEEDLARALLRSLSDAQRAETILSPDAPTDIVTSNARHVAILENRGLRYRQLHRDQQGILLSLIEEYAGAQAPEIARGRLNRLREAGMEEIRFAWMGGVERGQGHYYRIQGPTFLIEYDNTQSNANHIHTVWRDFEDDWGLDLLAAHYHTSPHHTHPA